MKPPNKARRPVAEAVERRAEAKENANRCRTCRTQCRESVSPAPERVRKAEASRQTSEVGAVCRKAARTVLCGGRPVMGVPTAIAKIPVAHNRCPVSADNHGAALRVIWWAVAAIGGECSPRPWRMTDRICRVGSEAAICFATNPTAIGDFGHRVSLRFSEPRRRDASSAEVRFAMDSPLEQAGFEPSVPLSSRYAALH